MKVSTLLFIFLASLNCALANDIDNLQTTDDVQKFLEEKVNRKWRKVQFFEDILTEESSTYGKGKFIKIDLDNNGLTDLIINAKYLFAVTDKGNGKYESHFIDRDNFKGRNYTLKSIFYVDKTPLLIIEKYSAFNLEDQVNPKPDTLTLIFGEFYEYNSTPDHFIIDEIRFTTSYCFGTCPVFELIVSSDGTANYHAIKYNDQSGKFHTVIDMVSIHKLFDSINYLNLTSLKDQYHVNWTDDQTATLEIKFNNGQVKKISDYGMIATFGLQHVYAQFFEFRKSQKWNR
ncbi:MAG: hypothetical protein HOP30_15175 [Cyclobacteriaceae bacterium]|nr:hypothetical protein [Cyclobacteriaceae bacterium]